MKTYELIITAKPNGINELLVVVDVPEIINQYRWFDDELLYMRERVSLLQSKLDGKTILINGLHAHIVSIELVETIRVRSKII
jgi:hypothetical protein